MTADCRKLLEKMENRTASRNTNLFVNPDAIILKKILAKSGRIVLANRDVTRELPMRKIFSKEKPGKAIPGRYNPGNQFLVIGAEINGDLLIFLHLIDS